MIKYYKAGANPGLVGTEKEYKFKLEGEEGVDFEKDAMQIAEEIGVEHIESHVDPQEWEEENDTEFEYDHWHTEITEEEYNNLDWEEEII